MHRWGLVTQIGSYTVNLESDHGLEVWTIRKGSTKHATRLNEKCAITQAYKLQSADERDNSEILKLVNEIENMQHRRA